MPLTHNMLPRPASKPVPRAQITTAAQIRDYASGGFHVCVDNANREAPGSARYKTWELAGSQYLAAFQLGAAGVVAPAALQAALAKLAQADQTAAQAKAMGPSTPQSPPPAPVDVSPNAPPVSEQIGPSGGLASIMASLQTTTIAGFPLWVFAVGIGGMLAWKKFSKPSARRAMRRASRGRGRRRIRSSRRLRKNPGRKKGPHRIENWKTSARVKLRTQTMSDKELIEWFEKGEKYSSRHSRKHKRPGTKGRPVGRASVPPRYKIRRKKKR